MLLTTCCLLSFSLSSCPLDQIDKKEGEQFIRYLRLNKGDNVVLLEALGGSGGGGKEGGEVLLVGLSYNLSFISSMLI